MFKLDTLADVYKTIGKQLLNFGNIYKPRGMETKELLNVNFVLNNPRCRLIYNPKRKFSLIYAIVESLMLVNYSNELKYYSYFNENIKQFSDDGITLNGAYGSRIAHLIPFIIKKIKEDKDSRQCVLPIYSYNDISARTKDVPCTLNLHFMIRNNKLNLHVYMRSNDIIWGTPYDIFQFTMLQEVLANELSIDIGKYYHNVTSLHVYEKFYPVLDTLVRGCFSGDTVPVEVLNKHDYNEWIKISNEYIKLVDNEHSNKFYQTAINSQFYKLLVNAKEHKLGRRVPFIIPEWSKPFVKRWVHIND